MENVIANSRSILVSTPARWQGLAASVPAELLALRPAANEWSALECLVHIIDTETVFQTRIKAFLAGQDFPGFNPDKEGAKAGALSAADLAARFAQMRQESLVLLDALTPADLDRQAKHKELGPVSLNEMIHEWAGHDLNHTIQAEQALIQPFIQGCGPWKVYFTSQMIKA